MFFSGAGRERFLKSLSTESSLTPIYGNDSAIEEWISLGTFRAKEKITAKPQQVVDLTLPKSPTFIIKERNLIPKPQHQKVKT